MTVGAHTEKHDARRAVAPDLGSQAPAPGDEFDRRQLVRRRGRAVDEVGDAVAAFQQQPLLRRMQQSRREPGGVKRRPEAIAGTGEVVPGGGRVKPGIDPAEQPRKRAARTSRRPLPAALASSAEVGLRRPDEVAAGLLVGVKLDLVMP